MSYFSGITALFVLFSACGFSSALAFAFEETFDNPKQANARLADVDWRANIGSVAETQSTGNFRFGPILAGSEFLFFLPEDEEYADIPWLAWTEKAAVEDIGDIGKVAAVTVRLSNESSTENIRIALNIDDKWYVSQDVLNNPTIGASVQFLDVKASLWSDLNFVPDEILEVGETTALPANGTVRAVGVFNDGTAFESRVRVDNFTVETNP